MEPFTLINPQGKKRDFGFVAFYAFKVEIARTNTFKAWAFENNISPWKDEARLMLKTRFVDRFLQEKGYTVIDNDIFGKKSNSNV